LDYNGTELKNVRREHVIRKNSRRYEFVGQEHFRTVLAEGIHGVGKDVGEYPSSNSGGNEAD
jgi:hypothetical protein